jgi:BirA family biotin operon repressor/biotin-[acetyl-CoA-carboxylase] ligase
VREHRIDGAGDGAPHPVEDLRPEAVGPRLATAWLGRRHVHVVTCGSTNDLAAAEARAGAAEGLLVTTDTQTAGRGRLGRSWHAPADESLAFSLLLRPARPAVEIPPLTLLVGAAVAAALRGLGLDARVKWPNDVLVRVDGRPRKVAGVLTEAASVGDHIGHVVVGIGINVNGRRFPAELAETATSLELGRGAPVDRVAVLAGVLAAIEAAYEQFRAVGPGAAVALWDVYADRELRCRARVDGRDVEGVAEGVHPDGALRLRDDDGVVHRIVAGEIVAKS